MEETIQKLTQQLNQLLQEKKNYESHWNYPNIDKAVEILNWYVETNDNLIGIICDSDADGACSAALIYNFLTSIGKTHIKMYFHEGKQHGITDKLEEIIQRLGKKRQKDEEELEF